MAKRCRFQLLKYKLLLVFFECILGFGLLVGHINVCHQGLWFSQSAFIDQMID